MRRAWIAGYHVLPRPATEWHLLCKTEEDRRKEVLRSLVVAPIAIEWLEYGLLITYGLRAMRAILREAMNRPEREGLDCAIKRNRGMCKGKSTGHRCELGSGWVTV